MALRFDGKVVIVTGAGGGLGREYALEFGKRGASVVVNDLGGGRAGEGRGARMADEVVAEIKKSGGKAVANYDSVEDGEAVVKTAIDNFGRVDVVVNNAGILRDKSFGKMTDLDWDLIQRVHLRGSFLVTRAAWPHMRKNAFGRIIMTSSNSGVYGNFGQANYSAAKLGLVGLSNTVAKEGAKYNINCNALVPTAGSRLTEDVMPAEVFEALKPEYAVPMVVYLCHESCTDTGGLFEAAAGWFGQLQWYRSNGAVLGTKATAEQVRDHWEQVTSMSGSKHMTNQDVMASLVEAVQNAPATPAKSAPTGSSRTNPALAKAHKFDEVPFSYNAKDAILYALGVGAGIEEDLKFVFESGEDFAVLPSFIVLPGFMATAGLGEAQGLHVDLTRLLHGEQYIELLGPLPTEGKLVCQAKIAEVLDKGSGASVLLEVEMKSGEGKVVGRTQANVFLRGEGGFGGLRSSPIEKKTLPVPKRAPDAVVEQRTSVDQAALYRQGSGDYNPLHIDPNFAQLSGFKKPILHGLCSFGFSVRHVLRRFANNDPSKIAAVKARFSKPVVPGQTLQTQMWKEGDRVHFQTTVKETGEVAISGAYVQMRGSDGGSGGGGGGSGPSLASDAVFGELEKRLKALPDVVSKTKAIFLWVITKDGKEQKKWTVDLKNGSGAIYEGEPKGDKAGVTLTLADDNMVGLVTGKLNPQQAFMSGKLKIKGNIMLTQKLQGLLKDQSKL